MITKLNVQSLFKQNSQLNVPSISSQSQSLWYSCVYMGTVDPGSAMMS